MDAFLGQIKAFFGNYMLMSAVVAWLLAQIIKIFTNRRDFLNYMV